MIVGGGWPIGVSVARLMSCIETVVARDIHCSPSESVGTVKTLKLHERPYLKKKKGRSQDR